MREAQHWEHLILADLAGGADPRRPPSVQQERAGGPSVTVAGLLDRFLDRHCAIHHKGHQQSKSLITVLKQFPLPARPTSVLNEADDINELQLMLRRKRYSVAYTNRLLEMLRGAINWTIKQPKDKRLVERNPFRK